jgi:cyanate permease
MRYLSARGLKIFGVCAVALLALATQLRNSHDPVDKSLAFGLGIAIVILAILIQRRPPPRRPLVGVMMEAVTMDITVMAAMAAAAVIKHSQK